MCSIVRAIVYGTWHHYVHYCTLHHTAPHISLHTIIHDRHRNAPHTTLHGPHTSLQTTVHDPQFTTPHTPLHTILRYITPHTLYHTALYYTTLHHTTQLNQPLGAVLMNICVLLELGPEVAKERVPLSFVCTTGSSAI